MYSPSKYDIWNVDLNVQDNIINTDTATSEVLNLITYAADMDNSFAIDMENNECTFVDIFLRNIANFHINRLNAENNEQKKYYPVFWTNTQSRTFDYIHMHVDHCDYSETAYKRSDNFPALSIITYFNNNDKEVTVLTDITKHMSKNHIFNHKLNEKLVIVAPRALRQLSFTGGINMHGEGYLSSNKHKDRKIIVLTLWEKLPLMAPIFRSDLFYSYIFRKKISIGLPLNEINKYDKDTNVITINPKNEDVRRIVLENNELINADFFKSLFVTRDPTILFKLKPYIDINKIDAGVIEFDIKQSNMWKEISNISPLIQSGLSSWKININGQYTGDNNISLDTELIEDTIHDSLLKTYTFDTELLFDMHSEYYNQIEQYIFNIASFHIQRINKAHNEMGYDIGEIYVSFYINTNYNSELSVSSDNSIQTILTSLDNNKDYSIITSINDEMYKYKNVDNSVVGVIYNKNSHVSYNGNYYHKYGKNTLIIRLWQFKPVNMPMYQIVIDNNELSIHNCNRSLMQKKIETYPKISIDENKNVKELFIEPIKYKRQLLQNILYNGNIITDAIPEEVPKTNICILSPLNFGLGIKPTNANNNDNDNDNDNDKNVKTYKIRSITFKPPKTS